jgi:lambda family phage portal protein
MANWLSRIAGAFPGGSGGSAPAPMGGLPPATVKTHSHSRVPSVVRMASNASRMDRATLSGFDIGRTGRRLASIPAYTSALNTLILQYGASAVARSRYLSQNNPYTAAAREAWVSAMAGTGIKPSKLGETAAVKQALQELWFDWCSEADFDGLQDHYGQQGMIAGEIFEAGEAFAIFEDEETDDGLPSFKIRLVPAEQCPYSAMPARVAPGNSVYMGIEFDAQGKRVAYHFLKRPPNEFRTDARSVTVDYIERVPADRVLHIFRPLRPGQVRGIPITLSGMVTLAMTDMYDDAELERKRTAALFAAFVQKSEGAEEGDSPLGDLVNTPGSSGAANAYPLEPGTVVGMEPGEEIKFSEPADVGGNYEAFQYRSLLKAAAGFGVPYSSFTGDLKAVNYSSIRAGLVEFRRRAEALQHNVMIFQFCRPVWRKFLDTATFEGLTPWSAAEYLADVRKHRRAKWLPPKWDWVDPKKDIEAEVIAVNNGFKARSDVIEAEGYDPEEVDERIAADKERADSLGLKFGDAAKPAPGNPQTDNPDDPDNPQTDNPDDPGEGANDGTRV